MKKEISVKVIEKYLAGNCTADEIAEVYQWFSSFDHVPEVLAGLPEQEQALLKAKLFEEITAKAGIDDQVIQMNIKPVAPMEALTEMSENVKADNVKIISLWPKIAVALTLLLVIGFAMYSILNSRRQATPQLSNTRQKDIGPGGNNAILTLANGEKIVLNQAKKGLLVQQEDVKVSKTDDGKLAYQSTNVAKKGDGLDQQNMLSTPKGGQYQISLPDGTKVWLNSLSYLKFPTMFSGKTRTVEIGGEAYFEVAKNPEKPFVVKSARSQVTVLGTHFNVNDYPDEAYAKTTLLEGAVRIKGRKSEGLLKPGEQASVNGNDVLNIDPHADMEEATAWKNGVFEFNKTDIVTIMRQAARWYDINVIFKGEPDHALYKGKISRNVNLSEMLTMIRYMGINYELQGKNLIIKN